MSVDADRAGHLQAAVRGGPAGGAGDRAGVLPPVRPVPGGPFHRGHVPDLRVPEGGRRPVRQVRESAERDGAGEPGVQSGRSDAQGGEPRDEASVPESAEAGAGAARVGGGDVGGERLVVERDQYHERVDRERAEAAVHHAGSEVGHAGAAGGLRRQGVLRVVRRADRVHQHHGELHEGVEAVVAEPEGREAGAVHGEGQHSVPHGDLPLHADRHARPLDQGDADQLHGVSQLRGRQVQQEPGNRRLRRPGEGHERALGGLAVLSAVEPPGAERLGVLLGGFGGEEQQRAAQEPRELRPSLPVLRVQPHGRDGPAVRREDGARAEADRGGERDLAEVGERTTGMTRVDTTRP